MSQLRQLLLNHAEYMAWANAVLLRACLVLTLEQLDRDLGVSHASVLGTFRHIYYAERAWLRRLVEDALPPLVEIDDESLFADPSPEPTLAELALKWPQLGMGYRGWLGSVDETALWGTMTTLMPDGRVLRVARWEIVVHAVNHSTLHRGQIVSMMRTLGLDPPNTDEFTYYKTH